MLLDFSYKIKPELITLSPEFIGSLASQEERPTYDAVGKQVVAPYSRLSRLERLRASGKADETEVTDEKDQGDADEEDDGREKGKTRKEKPEKMKMKGKGKSMKRYVHCIQGYRRGGSLGHISIKMAKQEA